MDENESFGRRRLSQKKEAFIKSAITEFLNTNELGRIEIRVSAEEKKRSARTAEERADQNKQPLTQKAAEEQLRLAKILAVNKAMDDLRQNFLRDRKDAFDKIISDWERNEKTEKKSIISTHSKRVREIQAKVKANIRERAYAYKVQAEAVQLYSQALQETMDAGINFSLPFQKSTTLLANTTELLIKAKAHLDSLNSDNKNTPPYTLDFSQYEKRLAILAQLQEEHQKLFKTLLLNDIEKENKIKELKNTYFEEAHRTAFKREQAQIAATAENKAREQLLKEQILTNLNDSIPSTHTADFNERLERETNAIHESEKRLMAVELNQSWNKIRKDIESHALEDKKPPTNENINKLHTLIKQYQLTKKLILMPAREII